MNGVFGKPDNDRPKLPRWWIRLIAACCAIVLCSCQAGPQPAEYSTLSFRSLLKPTQSYEEVHSRKASTFTQGESGNFNHHGAVPAEVAWQHSAGLSSRIVTPSDRPERFHGNFGNSWPDAETTTAAGQAQALPPASATQKQKDLGEIAVGYREVPSEVPALASGSGTGVFVGSYEDQNVSPAQYQAPASPRGAEVFSPPGGPSQQSSVPGGPLSGGGILRVERAPFIPREGPVYLYQPPGAREPWPPDEYLVAGGDQTPSAIVNQDWMIRGLQPGETIAHYDTVAGSRVVEPANPVYLYSPRFGAVRQVVGFRSEEQWEQLAAAVNTYGLARQEDRNLALSSKQHYQPLGQTGQRQLVQVQSRAGEGALSGAARLSGFHDGLLPYENLEIVRSGKLHSAELARIAEGTAAAQAWFHTAVVQVFIDRKAAVATEGITSVDVIYGVDEPPSHPRLRVIKLASRHHAAPGEIVHFTIRFDNVGNELIGNVTIVDSLPARLEYVPGSAQCSIPGEFLTEPNEVGSLILRWEITEPLQPGQGGVIRFQCRVR
jgi:uncharacterized repeat protein (TIGR01451 family)